MAVEAGAGRIVRGERGPMVAGAAGLVGVALGIAGGLAVDLLDAPGTASSASDITAFVDADRTAMLVGMLLNTAAVSLWIVFGAGVWLRLRQAAGGESLLAACFAFGLVGFAILLLAGFTSFFVLVYRTPVSDARLLYDLAFGLLAMSGAPTAIALGSFAGLVLRVGGLPRWTATLAAIGAAAHVVLLASFVVTDGFFSLEGQVITAIPATLFLWIAGTGIAMVLADS